ncbi:hypothetical protein Hypma_000217 [Hypsizygus marmoreus]|uniref:Uncharacterized protein n=1 Tax=Hypsizygus marmoreus TaxID=39966 RepID=A0A369JIA8_HYPMA|nr:hypothetical protein Hypma_000217 [Hypsizygus marmoreus]
MTPTDSANHRISRVPSFLGRPVQSPMGPRTRFPRSTTTSPDRPSSRDSLLTLNEPSPAYPSSPARSDSALPVIIEQPPLVDASPLQPIYKTLPKPATLVPTPSISFDSVPVQFKALPLEAALWTFNSGELREIVARAIRTSGRESFIRLLSLENTDTILPAEVERLTTRKEMAQSKYRFLVHRRTMLLQALNSSSVSPEKKVPEDGVAVVSKLTQQLSQTTAEGDELMEELLRVTDQLAQISKMTDQHCASALAVGLRKLNKSYAKRTESLISARSRIEQLELELEEAWKEAERVAREMDAIDSGAGALESDEEEDLYDAHEEAVIETAEKVPVGTASRRTSQAASLVLAGLVSKRDPSPPPPLPPLKDLPAFSPLSPMPRLSALTPSPITPHPMTPPHQDPQSDAASIRSTKSGKSAKSTRSGKSTRSVRTSDGTRLSLVSAAKTRSHRASKGSLRLPKTPLPHQYPPVPDLPIEFTSIPHTGSPQASSRLLPWGSDSASVATAGTVGTRMRRTSMDWVGVVRAPTLVRRRSSAESFTPTVTMDDIGVRPHMGRSGREDEIQVVMRTPPLRPAGVFGSYPLLLFVSDVTFPAPPDHPTQSIPSMWLMADEAPQKAPSTSTSMKRAISNPFTLFPSTSSSPAAPPIRRGASSSSSLGRIGYSNKLKILTKRYSLPFPLFKNRSAESHSELSPGGSSKSAPGGIGGS